MSWSRSPDSGLAPPTARSAPPGEHDRSPLAIVSIVLLLGGIAYAAAISLPAWETDTWVLNLLAQKTLRASSWSDALAVSRFVIDNPKGWSDVFILASWFAVYRVAGSNIAVFHAVGIACHLLSAALLTRLAARWSGSQRVALWTGSIFVLLPLTHDVVAVEAHSQYSLFGVLFLGSWILLGSWRERGSRAALVGGAVLYVLALGTKELSFALPPALLLEIAAAGGGRNTSRAVTARSWTALALTVVLAAPFFARPFWVALASPERATSPADAAMLGDLLHFVRPWVLVPKMVTDLGRWMLAPFADEGAAMRWFPLNALISITAFVAGVASVSTDRSVPRWRWMRAALWIVLGYLPVGFQLDRSSFEKTGELYLAAMGMALAWGELLGSGATLRRSRAILGTALTVAMMLHLRFLDAAMRAHGERVQAAVQGLELELEMAPPQRGLVIVGEEHLDRGAIDAMVLQISHDLGGLPAPVAWIGGGGTIREVAICPDDAWVIDTSQTRPLRWNDTAHRFERLDGPDSLSRALRWRNPDPERLWIRDACLVDGNARTVLTTEVLADLSPSTILPRL